MNTFVPVTLSLREQLMHLARLAFGKRPSVARLATPTAWPFWQVVSVNSIVSTEEHYLAIARLSLTEDRRFLSIGRPTSIFGLEPTRRTDSD